MEKETEKEMVKNEMNLPPQSPPVDRRRVWGGNFANMGIRPSSCSCPNFCIGPCASGPGWEACLGQCV